MLRAYEREVLERLEANGNPVGWKANGRDENGCARMRAEAPIPGGTRVMDMTITPKGLITSERVVVDA